MADVRDMTRIREVFTAHRPELVFHAAAMKHVPMVEMNPCEGVLTNIVGTRNVADACVEFGAKAMVLISTDKAVNPTSVMGATKRVAELIVHRMTRRGSTVRYDENNTLMMAIPQRAILTSLLSDAGPNCRKNQGS